MRFTNARVFTEKGFVRGSFTVENRRFSVVAVSEDQADTPDKRTEDIDLEGCKVIPGLVDIHIHGNTGADFSDGDTGGLMRISQYLGRNGVTSFVPTSISLPYEALERAFSVAAELHNKRPHDGSRVMGIHMEGPFLSYNKRGAHNPAYLKEPDQGAFTELYDKCNRLIRIVDIAPELEGTVHFIEAVRQLCTVSVAHTEAEYEKASAVFDAGATHVTHLFNTMTPLYHREPGVIGAASERDDICAELICDGVHVHPSAVRAAFKLFPDRICLVSDSIRCCGMPDGEYEFGGQTVVLSDNTARLKGSNTIAGGAVNLFECMRNAIRFGIPEDIAIRSATIIPARQIGSDDIIGSIEPGKYADFLVLNDDLSIGSVYIDGVKICADRLYGCKNDPAEKIGARFSCFGMVDTTAGQEKER